MEIMEVGKTVKYRGELYRSGRMSKWRWRIVASNGKILEASTQGFVRKSYAKEKLLASFEKYKVT
jgi:uncharacterized protein YegP (UPF0339 family)